MWALTSLVGPPCASAAPGPTSAKDALTGQAKPQRKQSAVRAKKTPPKSPSAAAQRAARLGLGTRRAAGELLAGRVSDAWLRSTGDAKPPGVLKFPVAKGWFVRGFGSGAGGYHQAMDIGGVLGSNVRAAASGLVGYAGDELSGYGNLVILIHTGGFVTAYAHNAKNLVVAGQRVERGAVIAELGSTGRSKGPHVHFEFLHGGQNCDPASLFRPGVRRKDGATMPIPRVQWSNPKRRPKAIACHPRKHHPGRAQAAHGSSETAASAEDPEPGDTDL